MLSYFQLNICSENFQVQHENGHTLSILWQLLFEKVLLLWGNLTENNSKIKEIFRRKNKSTHDLNNIHIKPCPRFDSAPSNWWGGGGVSVHTSAPLLLQKSISLPKKFCQVNICTLSLDDRLDYLSEDFSSLNPPQYPLEFYWVKLPKLL